jgi:hypothetical protein
VPKYHEHTGTEMAMRVLLIVKNLRPRPACEFADRIREEFGCSRATAYRYIATACAVLGIVLPKADSEHTAIKREQTRRERGSRTGFANPLVLEKAIRARLAPDRSHPWRSYPEKGNRHAR